MWQLYYILVIFEPFGLFLQIKLSDRVTSHLQGGMAIRKLGLT